METGMKNRNDVPVLVTGGTGTLGLHVVRDLLAAGQAVRVLSRGRRGSSEDGVEYLTGDLSTGEGIDAAFAGAESVIHLAGTSKGDEEKARHVVRAARDAGVRHLVFISVVGADRIPVSGMMDRAMFGYFASKRAAELTIERSGVPWTILRATQFHDLVLTTVRGMTKTPIAPVPSGLRFQPVEAAEVAARLVELALREPAGLVPDFAGPRVYGIADLVRGYLHATGERRLLVPIPVPGKAARAIRDGANLNRDRAVGRRTWEEFLLEHVTRDASTDRAADGEDAAGGEDVAGGAHAAQG